jgi:transcriptional regulator with XRE-family HTH domain
MRDFNWQKDPPATAHPIIKFIWRQMKSQRVPALDLAERAGIHDSTLRKWKKRERAPNLLQVIDVLQVLGYRLAIVEINERGGYVLSEEKDLTHGGPKASQEPHPD